MAPLWGAVEERVLTAVLLRPDQSHYRSGLARELGVSPSSLQRVLAKLIDAGIVRVRIDGNRTYYDAEVESPVFGDLQRILAKTSGVTAVIREALSEQADRISVAFVHGSMASGSATSSSDVDLIVIGSVRRSQIAKPLFHAAERLGREVNTVVMTSREFAQRVRDGENFLHSILENPRLPVVGSESDLEGIVGGAPDRL